MILGFKQFLDTKKQQPTCFREKILAGTPTRSFEFGGTTFQYNLDEQVAHEAFLHGRRVPDKKGVHPKLHTIRKDPHDRWKPGMSIQMVYRGAGYKIIDEFNKGIPELSKCVSTQRIHITWHDEENIVELPAEEEYPGEWSDIAGKASVEGKVIADECCTVYLCRYVRISIDGFCQDREAFEKLATNDGFSSTAAFLNWFKQDFTGKIIHWTYLRY